LAALGDTSALPRAEAAMAPHAESSAPVTPRASDVALARQWARDHRRASDHRRDHRTASTESSATPQTPRQNDERHRPLHQGRRGPFGHRVVVALGMALVLVLTSIGLAKPLAVQGAAATVPQMAGLAEADAVAALTAAAITPGARTTAYDGVVPAGIVISSDPPAGTVIETTVTAVNYVVSVGPAPQTLQPTPPPTPKPTKPPKPPKPKPSPWPTPPGIKGLDVSHWNGAPNFGTLRNSGMEFVFSKASQGTSMQDETFLRNTSEARAAGLIAGAYHFFDYTKAGKPQARHFLATVGNAIGFDGLLPLVVDVETLKSLGTPDQAKARARLHALLDELYRQTGRYPMIYTSRTMWDRVVGGPEEFGPYPLWVACWKCDNIHLPRGWSGWRFWQVGQFRFPDGARLDGNIYAAGRDKLGLEKSRPMRLEGGAEWATQTGVHADVLGFDGSAVRVALDGGGFGPWAPYEHPFPVDLGAKQGPRSVRLQLRSFRNVSSPIIGDDILVDSVPPVIKGPSIGIRAEARIAPNGKKIPITASLKAADATSGLARSKLEAMCGGSKRAGRKGVEAITDVAALIKRAGCSINGSATDNLGHTGTRGLNPRIALVDARSSSGQISLRGNWTTKKTKGALGKTLAQTTDRGARAVLRFTGAQFAIVARRGPAGGSLDVRLDGKRIGSVSLLAGQNDNRRIVYVRNVPKKKHVLELRFTGAADPAAATTAWLDAILVLDRRK
jgi:GH25 family lysozyme M1 (1,4-beta-N-acetylmuramidase)